MIEFSGHDRRKMAERNIPPSRVEEVLGMGRRSPDLKNHQRSVAVSERQETTFVFAQEEDRTVVITVWDELSR